MSTQELKLWYITEVSSIPEIAPAVHSCIISAAISVPFGIAVSVSPTAGLIALILGSVMFVQIGTSMLTSKGDVLLIKEIHKRIPRILLRAPRDVRDIMEFNSEVNQKRLVVVYYHAVWGSASLASHRFEKTNCIKVNRVVEHLNTIFKNTNFIKIESAFCDSFLSETPAFSNVKTFPSFEFYKNGKKVEFDVFQKLTVQNTGKVFSDLYVENLEKELENFIRKEELSLT